MKKIFTYEVFQEVVKMCGLQTIIKHCEENEIEIPAPEGYGKYTFGKIIKVWQPKQDPYRTMLNDAKLNVIKDLAIMAPDGIAYEFGCNRGGVTKMLLDIGYNCVAFDSFTGVQGGEGDELYENGVFQADLNEVEDYIPEATIVAGILPQSLIDYADEHKIARGVTFVHFDLDVRQPTDACLRFVSPILEPKGIMVFDDYGTWTTFGVKEAVDAFLSERVHIYSRLYLPTGQMVVFRNG